MLIVVYFFCYIFFGVNVIIMSRSCELNFVFMGESYVFFCNVLIMIKFFIDVLGISLFK